ncbi:MAG TPA: TetR/AcrR family transcriptional regulator, partial [Minicystis sp.]|nr:TetR/AcrR family transcriptional regulator [Minicystis sp.]
AVLAATLDELAEAGFADFSIEAVARRAGVHKTTVYRRWPTKAELVRAALESIVGQVPRLPDTGSLRKDLIALGETMNGFSRSARGHGITKVLVAAGPQSELFKIAYSIHIEYQKLPRPVLERAVARGELSSIAAGEMVLEALDAVIGHRCFIERRGVTKRYLERVVELLVDGARPRAAARRRTRG